MIFFSYFKSLCNQTARIRLAHIGESYTQFLIIASMQRMFGKEIDVVTDNHNITDGKIGIHTSGCIRNEEMLYPQFLHDTHREGNLFHIVSLVIVKTPLHSHDIFLSQFSEYQLPLMPFYCRHREIGNLGIRNFSLVCNVVYQLAQPSSQYNGGLRHHLNFCCDIGGCFFNLFNHHVNILVNNILKNRVTRRQIQYPYRFQ